MGVDADNSSQEENHNQKEESMKELLERLDARFEQVSETWVKDTFRSGYLVAISDIITVVRIMEEENNA